MCMQFYLSRRDLALVSVIGVLTVPLWIVPAIGYGVVAGVSAIKDKLAEEDDDVPPAAADKSDGWWRVRMERLQPLLEACEKNPTVQTLTTLGVAFFEQDDVTAARGYLRRAVELARAQKATNTPIYALSLYSYGLVLMRWQMWKEALDVFMEAQILVVGFANSADSSESATAASASAAAAAQQLPEAGGVSLNAAALMNKIGFCRLNHALYTMPYADAETAAPSAAQISEIDRAVSELEQAVEMDPQVNNKTGAISSSLVAVSSSLEYTVQCSVAKYYSLMFHNHDYKELRADNRRAAEFRSKMEAILAPLEHIVDDKSIVPRKARAAEIIKAICATAAAYASQLRYLGGDLKHGHIMAQIAISRGQPVMISKTFFFDTTGMTFATDDERNSYLHSVLVQPWPQQSTNEHCGLELHTWVQRSFHRPSWCRACSQFINLSENKAAYWCSACDLRAHAACYERVKDSSMCPKKNSDTSAHIHVMRKKTLHKPTFCDHCTKYIWNFKNCARCESCGIEVHDDCVANLKNAVAAPEDSVVAPKK